MEALATELNVASTESIDIVFGGVEDVGELGGRCGFDVASRSGIGHGGERDHVLIIGRS